MNVGTLTIEMAANLARLRTDMSDAKSMVGNAMADITSMVEKAQKAFVVLTGVASLEAFKGMILGAIEGAANLNKLSIQAGMTVEALSGLAVVGKATNTSAEQIAAASNKMSKALSSTNEDAKGAAAALKAIGLDFDAFQKMTPDERMRAVADAMNLFKDGAQKSAAAMILMGRAGAEMLPYLRDLAQTGDLVAKVTGEQAEQAHQFEAQLGKLKTNGEAWRRTLALELLPTLNDIVDVLLTLKKSTADVGDFLGTGFKIVLQTVAVVVVNTSYVLKQMGLEIYGIGRQLWALATLDFSGFTSIGAKMTEDAAKARVEVDKLTSSLLGLTNSKAGAGRGGTAFTDPRSLGVGEDFKGEITGLAGDKKAGASDPGLSFLDSLKSKYEALMGTTSEYAQALRKLAEIKKDVSAAIRDQIISYAKLIDQKVLDKKISEDNAKFQEEQYKLYQQLEDATTASFVSLVAMDTEQQTAIGLLGQSADAIERLTLIRRKDAELLKLSVTLSEGVAAGLISETGAQKTLASATGVANKALQDQLALQVARNARDADAVLGAQQALEEYQKQVNNVAGNTKNVFTSAIKGMEDSLVSFVTTGKGGFKNLANSIIADMVRIQVQQSIMKPLTAAMQGNVGGGSFFSSLWNGVSSLFGSSSSNIGSWTSGMAPVMPLPGMAGFANGGNPPLNVPSMVGERGPELFVPNTAGRIVPNDKLGGQQITYAPVINIDSRTDRAEVYGRMDQALRQNNEQFTMMLKQQGVF